MSNLRHSFHDKNSGSGFSLVELSIVLVILGLLTGGIVAGQSLIHAASLRKVTNDAQNFSIMIFSFYEKYGQYPGDMSNATAFWGESNNCGGSDLNGVCNGNADGVMTNSAGMAREHWQFWRHMAKADMIPGEFTGVGANGIGHVAKAGENVPESNYGSAVWHVVTSEGTGPYAFINTEMTGEVDLDLAPVHTSMWPGGAIMLPEDTWNLDNKVDDGKPATGKFISHWWEYCTLASNQNDINADYDLSRSDNVCAVKFRNIFQQ